MSMKRLLIVCFLVLGGIAAVFPDNISSLTKIGESSSITITLDTSKGFTDSKLEVGFATSSISSFDDVVTYPDDSITLSLSSDRIASSELSEEDNGEHHVYWKVASNDEFVVKLSLTPLKKDTTEIPLTITVGENDLTSTASDSDSQTSKTVFSHEPGTGTHVGSVQLKNIRTGTINSEVSGTYTATLTLSVTSVS